MTEVLGATGVFTTATKWPWLFESMSPGDLGNPFEKICESQIGLIFPNVRGGNKKNVKPPPRLYSIVIVSNHVFSQSWSFPYCRKSFWKLLDGLVKALDHWKVTPMTSLKKKQNSITCPWVFGSNTSLLISISCFDPLQTRFCSFMGWVLQLL